MQITYAGKWEDQLKCYSTVGINWHLFKVLICQTLQLCLPPLVALPVAIFITVASPVAIFITEASPGGRLQKYLTTSDSLELVM